MFARRIPVYGLLAVCLLLAGCSAVVLDKVIIYPAYSFNKDHTWFVDSFKLKFEQVSGFELNKLGNLERHLTDKIKLKLTGAGVKVLAGQPEDKTAADYILKGAIVYLNMREYDKNDMRYRRSQRDRWGRAEFEPNTNKMSNISISGKIVQVSTNKMMAGFELYESTFLDGSAGVEVLLETLSSKIVDIVLGERT